ncbi:MAG: hypothetical protein GX178_06210 [Acidobacteria bacterium]|nr:hypothetical protein [Thermoanaerobaculia bacterium]NLN11182.1 hypothetical protein [Acidobacteriota bacterium]OQC42139.1 MAG: hypothetical protein BWX64_00386 [Acidobacteria bacterium ADurb.Bin051]MBP7813539.1 hypothetical protein [Thermoanaerobaculia bacterium]MBP8844503.1 hypothetical protein [Thermoanaerobaculia bacterium]
MQQLTLLLALLAAVAAGALVVWQGAPWEVPAGAFLPVLALAVWVAGPFALLALSAALARSRRAVWIVFASVLFATVGSGAIWFDAFVRRPHPLHALLHLALPSFQYPLAGLALAAALLSRRRARSEPSGG